MGVAGATSSLGVAAGVGNRGVGGAGTLIGFARTGDEEKKFGTLPLEEAGVEAVVDDGSVFGGAAKEKAGAAGFSANGAARGDTSEAFEAAGAAEPSENGREETGGSLVPAALCSMGGA